MSEPSRDDVTGILAVIQAEEEGVFDRLLPACVVTLRYFAGLTVNETAKVVEVSPAPVKREWQAARAWLFRRLTEIRDGGSNDGTNDG